MPEKEKVLRLGFDTAITAIADFNKELTASKATLDILKAAYYTAKATLDTVTEMEKLFAAEPPGDTTLATTTAAITQRL